MKQILNYITDFFEAITIARKASCLARAGRYKEIKSLYENGI